MIGPVLNQPEPDWEVKYEQRWQKYLEDKDESKNRELLDEALLRELSGPTGEDKQYEAGTPLESPFELPPMMTSQAPVDGDPEVSGDNSKPVTKKEILPFGELLRRAEVAAKERAGARS